MHQRKQGGVHFVHFCGFGAFWWTAKSKANNATTSDAVSFNRNVNETINLCLQKIQHKQNTKDTK